MVEHRGRIVDRTQIAGAHRARLEELIAEHRAAFDGRFTPEPFGLWASATEKFVFEVHDLVSRHLLPLLNRYPRVGLDPTNSTLFSLPIETAHRHGAPALFELCQTFRVDRRRHDGPGRRRTFDLDHRTGDANGLHAVVTEQALIRSSYRTEPPPDAQRIVHLAGHEPILTSQAFAAEERAHLVLSGCDSLPRRLPTGIASATGSLWPIDDHSNAGFMALFHGRVSIGVGPAEALRQSQLLQRALPPVVWAAYAHLGQPD